uniref:Putative secreted protein n=1 Tax=Anopheles darlingi TaxID=43151 RepID=A0A2M4D5Q0_ANODA
MIVIWPLAKSCLRSSVLSTIAVAVQPSVTRDHYLKMPGSRKRNKRGFYPRESVIPGGICLEKERERESERKLAVFYVCKENGSEKWTSYFKTS